jgi:cyclohexanecarboxylate-CoA ligase
MISCEGVWQAVEQRAATTPDALFAVDDRERRLSFSDYRDAALRCAAGLAEIGIGEGTRVSWMLPTWHESLVLVAALARLGAVQNPILPIYRHREVGFIAGQFEPEHVFVPGRWRGFDYAGMAREIRGEQERFAIHVVDPDGGGALPDGDPSQLGPAPGAEAANERRWILYTSGTTADPKGAIHSDATLLVQGRSLCRVLELEESDRVALVFPLTHIGGLGWLLASLLSGCSHIVVPIFDPATSIDVLARHGVTQATAGTVFHQAYLAAQRAKGSELLFPGVRAFPGGGAPRPPSLHAEIKAEMGGAGIISGYGLTECPIVSMNTVRDPGEQLATSEGRPNPPEMKIRILRSDGSEAGTGKEGEICASGPQLCLGYLDAKLDSKAFDADGFFHTGDLGHVDDDGFVFITGRLKDVIIRKGENISAKEIEDHLFAHPHVADAAVIGLPDASRGERACAVICWENGANAVALEDLCSFLRERGLMNQKLPEQLESVDALPRNASGKVLKHELRKRYQDA